MSDSWFIRSSAVGLRCLRSGFSPWLMLTIALFTLPFSSGATRVQAKLRYLKAIASINFVGVYNLINDLLW
jgi:hypothetical protein